MNEETSSQYQQVVDANHQLMDENHDLKLRLIVIEGENAKLVKAIKHVRGALHSGLNATKSLWGTN
jgi:hypothetical protein